MILLCFLAKNCLILKVLEKTWQGANSTAQRMAENTGEMNAFQSPSCIFLALIGGGLFFHFCSVWLPQGAPTFLQAFWKAFPASPARMLAPFFDLTLLSSLLTALHNTCPTSTWCRIQDLDLFLFCMYIHVISVEALSKNGIRKNVNSNSSPSTH